MHEKSKTKRSVLVAMSGGVDSSVAAYLLQKEGYEVIGATMKLFCYERMEERTRACCSLEAVSDAKNVCEKLGIPHYVISYENEFEKEVVNDFVSEYKRGRTPNPCIRCNQLIKFDYFLKKAKELGCDYLATGHYARILSSSVIPASSPVIPARQRSGKHPAGISSAENSFKLLKGIDENKDQTYFLYRLNQKQLARLKFPLGKLTKKEVRKVAEEAGLKTAAKAESQGICFVDAEVSDYLKGIIKVKKGVLLDIKGKKIGEHEGAFFYTIGQRKGLGGGFEEPLYVLGIDINKNTVTIGEDRNLYKHEVEFEDASWVRGKAPDSTYGLRAVIRYGSMQPEKMVKLEKINKKYKAVFKKKVRAVTPGQAIVFYKGDECLGGGIIRG